MNPALLLEVLGLKRVARAGWVRRGLTDVESVADHSWGVAWLVLVLLPQDMDRGRALSYAVLHDLAEVRVGDLVPADGVSAAEKHQRERHAIDNLLADRPHLQGVWAAYEAQQDPEAQFVRELDRLEMALQAIAYQAAHGLVAREFLDSAARAIHHPDLRRILDVLYEMSGEQPS